MGEWKVCSLPHEGARKEQPATFPPLVPPSGFWPLGACSFPAALTALPHLPPLLMRLFSLCTHLAPRSQVLLLGRCLSLQRRVFAAMCSGEGRDLQAAAATPHATAVGGESKKQRKRRLKLEGGQQEKRPKRELPYACPSCSQGFKWVAVLHNHVSRCCPDLTEAQAWARAMQDETQVPGILSEMGSREAVLRAQVLHQTFQNVVSQPRPPDVVAAAMQLPLGRVSKLLEMAQRSIPLVADKVEVEVLFEDKQLVAFNKPPNISTAPKHRFQGGSLVNRVIHYLGSNPYPLHRLDMYTSGVVLMSKEKSVVAPIHALFRDQDVQKLYYAVCAGVPSQEEFTVDAPIGDHPTAGKWTRSTAEGGQEARTDFRVLAQSTHDFEADVSPSQCGKPLPQECFRSAALVACRPRTGRTHQIRLHLHEIGHPIIGDNLYGVKVPWAPRQLLHAARLELVHPGTGNPLRVTAPLPGDFLHAMQVLGLQDPQES